MQSPDLEISSPPTHTLEPQQLASGKNGPQILPSNSEKLDHEDNENNSGLLKSKEMFDFSDLGNIRVWRNASAEFWAAGVLTFMVGASVALTSNASYPFPSIFIGFAHLPIIGLLIVAIGPISGGHLNPIVTMTAVFTRVLSFPCGLAYIACQTVGAALGGALLRSLCTQKTIDTTSLGACVFENTMFSVGSAFIGESVIAFTIAFVVHNVALDPKQSKEFSLSVTAFVVGATFAMVVWLSGGINPGWPGAGTNPAKCFGLSVGSGNFSHHWIAWVGPLFGTLTYAIAYSLMSPFHNYPKKQRKDSLR
ncbi:13429_t:CDS:2, partial [Ambispora leptoticha]